MHNTASRMEHFISIPAKDWKERIIQGDSFIVYMTRMEILHRFVDRKIHPLPEFLGQDYMHSTNVYKDYMTPPNEISYKRQPLNDTLLSWTLSHKVEPVIRTGFIIDKGNTQLAWGELFNPHIANTMRGDNPFSTGDRKKTLLKSSAHEGYVYQHSDNISYTASLVNTASQTIHSRDDTIPKDFIDNLKHAKQAGISPNKFFIEVTESLNEVPIFELRYKGHTFQDSVHRHVMFTYNGTFFQSQLPPVTFKFIKVSPFDIYSPMSMTTDHNSTNWQRFGRRYSEQRHSSSLSSFHFQALQSQPKGTLECPFQEPPLEEFDELAHHVNRFYPLLPNEAEVHKTTRQMDSHMTNPLPTTFALTATTERLIEMEIDAHTFKLQNIQTKQQWFRQFFHAGPPEMQPLIMMVDYLPYMHHDEQRRSYLDIQAHNGTSYYRVDALKEVMNE